MKRGNYNAFGIWDSGQNEKLAGPWNIIARIEYLLVQLIWCKKYLKEGGKYNRNEAPNLVKSINLDVKGFLLFLPWHWKI